MYMVIVLLLQGMQPAQLTNQSAAKLILSRAAEVKHSIEDWQYMVDGRFAKDLQLPKVGVFIGSNSAPGPDGLHSVFVLGVHTNSPAQHAGIRPGDRILRIDQRRLEHESTTIVHMLMNNKPGPVRLTIQRGQEVLELTVWRELLPCLDQAVDLLNLEEVRSKNAKILELLETIRLELERAPAGPETLDAAQAGVGAAARFLEHSVGAVNDNLYRATVTTCQTSFD